MKILYFDLFLGVSAQSIFSALYDIINTPSLNVKADKYDVSGILCTNAQPLEDNLFSQDDFLFAKNVCKNILRDEKEDTKFFCAINHLLKILSPDFIISSPIYDGSVFDVKTNMCIPSPNVLKMFKDLKIPYESLKIQKQLAKEDGIAVIKSVSNDFGTLPKLDIDKIGYGTDGDTITRVVTGYEKQDSLCDIFEISEEIANIREISYLTK